MSTLAPDQLQEAMATLSDAAQTALANETIEDFVALERYANEVEVYVRELQQSMWAAEVKEAIRHVEGGEPLSPTDVDVIRAFLISDAERYVALENNYADWCRELQRLMGDVSKRAHMVDRGNIADLRAVLKDAVRLIPDIRNYLDEKARIERFEQALNQLDPASRKLMAKVLREALESPKR